MRVRQELTDIGVSGSGMEAGAERHRVVWFRDEELSSQQAVWTGQKHLYCTES